MADKQVTVAVPEERVPEFYLWFAQFLASDGGGPPPWAGGPPWGARASHGGEHPGWQDDPASAGDGPPWSGPRGRRRGPGGAARGGMHMQHEAAPWSAQDSGEAIWLYGKLAPPARELLDLLIDAPGKRFSGNEIAARLRLEKGAHGVAGILAWPGRYSRKLGRELPISTEGREDGGTDYYLDAEVATLFAEARATAG